MKNVKPRGPDDFVGEVSGHNSIIENVLTLDIHL